MSDNENLFTQIKDTHKTNVVISNGNIFTSYGSNETELARKNLE